MTALTDDELDLVRSSYRELAAATAESAATFYDRLFLLEPGVRPLFPSEMELQGMKMMSMLGVIVAQMHDHAALEPILVDLARRHVVYGARPEHYAAIGEAMLWTLQRRLGTGFTAAHEAAWRRAYAALASIMMEAVA